MGQKYEKVTTSEIEGEQVFTIDDEAELSMATLTQRHNELLHQAKSSITEAETHVQWLQEERKQNEHSLVNLHAAGLSGSPLANGTIGRAVGRRQCGVCCCTCTLM